MQWDQKFGWAGVISIAIFVAGYFVRWAIDWAAEERQKRKFFIALFTEIKLNTEALREDASIMPKPVDMNPFLRADPKNRPHMVSLYITDIYKSNLQMLPLLPDVLIKRLISFYGDLDFINAVVKSFDNTSFEIISQAGREQAYLALCEELDAAADRGNALLDQIKLQLKIPELTS